MDTLQGYAQKKMAYDRLGRPTMTTYLDAGGQAVITDGGYASEQLEYDAMGRTLAVKYLDASGTTGAAHCVLSPVTKYLWMGAHRMSALGEGTGISSSSFP